MPYAPTVNDRSGEILGNAQANLAAQLVSLVDLALDGDYTEYSFSGTAVARIRMTYFGGVPATDNAQLKSSFIQYPPFA